MFAVSTTKMKAFPVVIISAVDTPRGTSATLYGSDALKFPVAIRYSEVRLDASRVKELPDGSIRVPAVLTHTGIFPYRNPDGSIRREYRPAEEVFRADAIASFADVPVTISHPAERRVDATTWRRDAIGHLSGAPRQDGENMVGDLLIRDAGAISRVRSGDLHNISCGYRVDYDSTPGVTPDGQKYDGVQRNLVGNHVAILPRSERPRGGESCSLRLDSEDNEIVEDYNINSMTPEEIKALQTRCDSLVAENAVLKTAVEPLKTQITVLQGELATAKAVVATPAEVPAERLDALVEERAEIVALAKANGVETQGLKTLAVKRAIVAKRTPALADRIDSLTEQSLDVALATYKEGPHPSMTSAVAPLVAPVTRTDSSTNRVISAREKFQADMAKEWQSPGTFVAVAPGTLLNGGLKSGQLANLSQTVGA